jgi:hypothetical protein
MPKGSRTAFASADVADAKRGRPEVNLDAFAAAHGLESLGSALVGAFTGLLPMWPDYVFNAARGEVAPGKFGLVEHELYEISLRPDGDLAMPGSFHRTVTTNRFSVGRLVGVQRSPKNEPFAADSAWAPTTGVLLRVPGAALLPRVLARRKEYLGLIGNPDLSDDGAPGLGMSGSQFISDDLRHRLFTGAAGAALSGLTHPFVEVELDRGALALRVNGFVSDDAELEQLVQTAATIADAWTEVARPLWSGADLGAPLAAPDPDARPPGFPAIGPEWREAYGRIANDLGLTAEDPVELHRAAPGMPVPGTAEGVLRGPVGGTTATGRLLWTSQGARTSGSVRGAAWFPARAGATTPLGGQLHQPTDMYAEVVDGSAWCWARLRSIGALESAALGPRAVQTMTDLGLADLDG